MLTRKKDNSRDEDEEEEIDHDNFMEQMLADMQNQQDEDEKAE